MLVLIILIAWPFESSPVSSDSLPSRVYGAGGFAVCDE